MGSRLVGVFLVSACIFVLAVGKLMCLPPPPCTDKTRNAQSIVGLNIKERTARLLERSTAVRSWKHLLSEKVLKISPFRENDLSGN